ncbi:50S ribosomal protein L23 [Candidatus Woesearchaeota archaeon]|nr:50S ribosomal protein L23 [Candidatus Woesearchaeota archaeon]
MVQHVITQDHVIKHPLSTEKSIRMMEADNTLAFIVDMNATKHMIRQAAEEMFKARVTKVTTLINNKGMKKAYIRFSAETPAIDIATQMGLM